MIDYWGKVKGLAAGGISTEQLVRERCPIIVAAQFASVNLKSLAEKQLEKLHQLLEG